MTLEKQDITQDFYEADKKDIDFEIRDQNGALIDLSPCEIAYALFKDDAKNPTTLIRKTSLEPTEIEVTGLGHCIVHFLPGDTFNLYGTFRHQLYVMDANGYGEIVSSGRVDIFRSFARRILKTLTHAYLQGTL